MYAEPDTNDPDDVPPLWSALSARDFEASAGLVVEGVCLDDLAVDQVWYEIKGTQKTIGEIRAVLASYPDKLCDRQDKQNKQKRIGRSVQCDFPR